MEVTPYITPPDTCLSPLVFIPSDDAEILCFELFTGQMIQRIRGMERNFNGRVTCVTGRPSHHVRSFTYLTYNRKYIQGQLTHKLGFGNHL
jgi:hypothetical protein